MKSRYLSSLAVGFAALLYGPSPALAQAYLGTNLRPFSVLAGTTVTCTGAAAITGSIGVSPGSATAGFPVPCAGVPIIPPAADPAQADLLTAYGTLAALSCSSTVGPDLAGLTLVPGVYCIGAAASNLTGTVTLNGLGNPNSVWVFQSSSSLITSSGSTVSVINGGSACAVEWQVSSSATIGSGTTFVGNILALTSISLGTGATLNGRALARNGAVTLDANTISNAGCLAAGQVPPPFPGPVPTLPEIGAWTLLLLLLGTGAYLVSRRTPTVASR
jgi:type VI secretion system secreted protein VgrG